MDRYINNGLEARNALILDEYKMKLNKYHEILDEFLEILDEYHVN